MTRDKVLARLARHTGESLLFSELTRVLITNDKTERARSREARAELRLVLASLQDDGLVRLTPSLRNGVTVTVLEAEGAGA